MSESLPIFLEDNFRFKEAVPPHEEMAIASTDLFGSYSLSFAPRAELFMTRGRKTIFTVLAAHVPNMEMVTDLASARIAKQEPFIKAYGHADDLYAFLPDGSVFRVYEGWECRSSGYIGGSSRGLLPD